MIYETGQIWVNSGDGNSWATNLYNFISQYYSNLTVSENTIVFDGKFTLSFTYSNGYPKVTLIRNSGVTNDLLDLRYWGSVNQTANLTLIITDDVFYIKIIRGNVPSEGHGAIIWLQSENTNFVGMSNATNPVIETTYYNAENDQKGSYTLGKVANYAVMPLKIVYSKLCPIVQTTGGEVLPINGLVSCSTISLYSTITFGGNTYHAIGTNTLIPLSED
jgi:hypothetical protein